MRQPWLALALPATVALFAGPALPEAPPGRYAILSVTAVKDTVTGLVWTRKPTLTTTSNGWTEALLGCESLAQDGKDDWRLPAIREVFSLFDHSSTDQNLIDRNAFDITGITTLQVFSSTPSGVRSGTSATAQMVNGFTFNGATGITRLSQASNVRYLCVRGPDTP